LSGSLAYFLEPAANTTVQWMDPAGKVTSTVGVPAGRYTAVALAPDRTRAILVRRSSGLASSMWLVDLTRESAIPLPVRGGRVPSPVWSPDSTRFVFAPTATATASCTRRRWRMHCPSGAFCSSATLRRYRQAGRRTKSCSP
jgi:hypothetical protein